MNLESNNPIPASVRNRLTATLFTSESLFSAATIASFTLMPILARSSSGRESLAGIPSTMMLIGQAAAAYPLGRLMDRFGRRKGLSLGYFVAAIGAILAVFSIGWGAFVGFCLGVGLFGVGRAGGLQARFAAAEIQEPSRRAKAIGVLVFAGTVGAVFGPLLAGPSSQMAIRYGFDGMTGPYILAAFLFYVAFFLTFVLLRPDPMTLGKELATAAEADAYAESGIPTPTPQARPLRAIFAGPGVRLALLAMIVGQLVMTMIMVITPLYMNSLGYTTQDISWVIMAHTLGMFALSGVTGWLIDRTGRITMIVAGGARTGNGRAVGALLEPVGRADRRALPAGAGLELLLHRRFLAADRLTLRVRARPYPGGQRHDGGPGLGRRQPLDRRALRLWRHVLDRGHRFGFFAGTACLHRLVVSTDCCTDFRRLNTSP